MGSGLASAQRVDTTKKRKTRENIKAVVLARGPIGVSATSSLPATQAEPSKVTEETTLPSSSESG